MTMQKTIKRLLPVCQTWKPACKPPCKDSYPVIKTFLFCQAIPQRMKRSIHQRQINTAIGKFDGLSFKYMTSRCCIYHNTKISLPAAQMQLNRNSVEPPYKA